MCPNPISCTYSKRQQLLQQLQVDVRNTYYAEQYQMSAEGDATGNTTNSHRLLVEQSSTSSSATTAKASLAPVSTQTSGQSASAFLSLIGRSLVQVKHTHLNSSVVNTSTANGVVARSDAVKSKRSAADATFIDAFFFAAAPNLSSYVSAQCTEGYTGRLCASCIRGYGSHGIATCKPCSRFNTLYYTLALMFTLCFLTWTFYSIMSYARRRELATQHSSGAAVENGYGQQQPCFSKQAAGPTSGWHAAFTPNDMTVDCTACVRNTNGNQTTLGPGLMGSEWPAQTPAWHHLVVCSPSSLERMSPCLLPQVLSTPSAVDSSFFSTPAHSPLGVSIVEAEFHSPSHSHPLDVPAFAVYGPAIAATAQPAPHMHKGRAVSASSGILASYQPWPVSSPPASPGSCPFAFHGTALSGPDLRYLFDSCDSFPHRKSTTSSFSNPGSARGCDAATSQTTAVAKGIRLETSPMISHSSLPSTTTLLSSFSSKQHYSLFPHHSLGSCTDSQQTGLTFTTHELSDRWYEKDSRCVDDMHIRGDPWKHHNDDSESDSHTELESRTSYFADLRDPVVENSHCAAMVVTRIFLSYLQVSSFTAPGTQGGNACPTNKMCCDKRGWEGGAHAYTDQ